MIRGDLFLDGNPAQFWMEINKISLQSVRWRVPSPDTAAEALPADTTPRLLVALMKRYGFVPKRIITDKLRSYGAAKADVAPGLDHWSHKGLNIRAENSHLPFRKRERTMQGHRSPGALQRFVSMHSATRNCFSVPSRRRAAQTIR